MAQSQTKEEYQLNQSQQIPELTFFIILTVILCFAFSQHVPYYLFYYVRKIFKFNSIIFNLPSYYYQSNIQHPNSKLSGTSYFPCHLRCPVRHPNQLSLLRNNNFVTYKEFEDYINLKKINNTLNLYYFPIADTFLSIKPYLKLFYPFHKRGLIKYSFQFSLEYKNKAVSPFFMKFRIPKDVGVNLQPKQR